MRNANAFLLPTNSTLQIPEPKALGKVAVLYGGRSSEREVSLSSGQQVLAALLAQGVDAHGIDVGPDLLAQLSTGFDRAFIALHGREGEDGVIQGLLQLLNIPYTGSGVSACALAMDKVRAKLVMQSLNIATLSFSLINSVKEAQQFAHEFGYPICIKPVHEGSSIGVTKVVNSSQLQDAFNKAALYGQVMIEPWVVGNELTVGIVNDVILPPIQIQTPVDFYDYEAKYESNDTQYLCPPPLSTAKMDELKQLSYQAFCALGCSGWGRVDLIQDGEGKFWVLEINTSPGMTPHSLVPMSAKVFGYDFAQLVLTILGQTLKVNLSATQTLNEAISC